MASRDRSSQQHSEGSHGAQCHEDATDNHEQSAEKNEKNEDRHEEGNCPGKNRPPEWTQLSPDKREQSKDEQDPKVGCGRPQDLAQQAEALMLRDGPRAHEISDILGRK